MMGKTLEGEESRASMLYVYVADCDTTCRKALEAGANVLMEPADQFYGDRSGGFMDEQGIQWFIATRIENLSTEEIHVRLNSMYEDK